LTLFLGVFWGIFWGFFWPKFGVFLGSETGVFWGSPKLGVSRGFLGNGQIWGFLGVSWEIPGNGQIWGISPDLGVFGAYWPYIYRSIDFLVYIYAIYTPESRVFWPILWGFLVLSPQTSFPVHKASFYGRDDLFPCSNRIVLY